MNPRPHITDRHFRLCQREARCQRPVVTDIHQTAAGATLGAEERQVEFRYAGGADDFGGDPDEVFCAEEAHELD